MPLFELSFCFCKLAEYCLPLVRVGGLFVAAKGHNPEVHAWFLLIINVLICYSSVLLSYTFIFFRNLLSLVPHNIQYY